MKKIVISDYDIADININVAKESLIKARCSSGQDRKVKALLYARQAIDKAIKSFGFDVHDIEFEKLGSSQNSSKTSRKNKK